MDDHRYWLDLLTGPGAEDVLAAALGADGAELESWTLRQTHARPGAEVTVAYDVVARRGSGAAAQVAAEHLFVTSAARVGRHRGEAGLDRGVVRLDDGERVLHVWRHPHDPELPGLEPGCTPADVAARLTDAGLGAHVGAGGVDVLALETVAYRPLRRAVLRARTSAGTVYVKVVRPGKVGDLVRRHALFERPDDGAGSDATVPDGGTPPALAAPAVLGWADDGVVLLAEVTGRSLAEHLAATPSADQPSAIDPGEILRVARALPAGGADLTRRPAWADRLDRYAATLPEVHDVDADRVRRLAAGVDVVVARRGLGPTVTTHGDLHAANLLLVGGSAAGSGEVPARIGAVLDVDTLGPGHLVDDLACAVAHLAVLPTLAPGVYDGVDGLVQRCLAVFDAEVDPAVLRARAAAVVVSLAVGAADSALANRWLTVAEDLVAFAEGF